MQFVSDSSRFVFVYFAQDESLLVAACEFMPYFAIWDCQWLRAYGEASGGHSHDRNLRIRTRRGNIVGHTIYNQQLQAQNA